MFSLLSISDRVLEYSSVELAIDIRPKCEGYMLWHPCLCSNSAWIDDFYLSYSSAGEFLEEGEEENGVLYHFMFPDHFCEKYDSDILL